jgi:hypothetical protein
MGPKATEEDDFACMVAWRVDIRDPKGEPLFVKARSTDKACREATDPRTVKSLGSQTETRPPEAPTESMLSKARRGRGRKEGGFGHGDGPKLSFLEADDARFGGKESRTHNVTLIRVTQAANVPGTDHKAETTIHL